MSKEGENRSWIAAPCIVFPRNSRSTSNAPHERTRPHRPANLEVSEIVGEVEQPISKFDAGNVFAHIHAVACGLFDIRHSGASDCSVHSEQLGNEADRINIRNTLNTLTFFLFDEPLGAAA